MNTTEMNVEQMAEMARTDWMKYDELANTLRRKMEAEPKGSKAQYAYFSAFKQALATANTLMSTMNEFEQGFISELES